MSLLSKAKDIGSAIHDSLKMEPHIIGMRPKNLSLADNIKPARFVFRKIFPIGEKWVDTGEAVMRDERGHKILPESFKALKTTPSYQTENLGDRLIDEWITGSHGASARRPGIVYRYKEMMNFKKKYEDPKSIFFKDKDSYHHMITAATRPSYREMPEYQKWYNGLDEVGRQEVNTLQKMQYEMLDGYGRHGRDLGHLPKHTKLVSEGGEYAPSSLSGHYKVITPGNLDEIQGVRAVTIDDIMNHKPQVRYSSATRRDAEAWVKSQNLHGYAVVSTEGYIPSEMLSATKDKNFAEYIFNSMKGSFIAKDPLFMSKLRNIAADEIKMAKAEKTGRRVKEYLTEKFGHIEYKRLKSKLEKQYGKRLDDLKPKIIKDLGEKEFARQAKFYGESRLIGMYTHQREGVRYASRPFSPHQLKSQNVAEFRSGFRRTPEMNYTYEMTMMRKEEFARPMETMSKLLHTPKDELTGELREAREMIDANPAYRQYLENFVDNAMGVPHKSVKWLAQYTAPYGIDERAIQGYFGKVMQVQALLKIGVNPLNPLINGTQLWTNVGGLLGFKYVVKAYHRRMFDKAWATRMLRHAEHLTIPFEGADAEKIVSALPLDRSPNAALDMIAHYTLYPFRKVEINHNRSLAYLAGVLKGIDMGLPEDSTALMYYANKVVQMTQFNFGQVSQPWIMTNPVLKPIMQFKPYLLNQMHFIGNLADIAYEGIRQGDVTATYPFMRVMAAYGVLGGISSVPFMGFFQERSSQMNKMAAEHPYLFRGLPSLSGFDVSRRMDIHFPNKGSEWINFFLGPTGSDIARGIKAVPELAKGAYGQKSRAFVKGITPLGGSIMGVGKSQRGLAKVDSSGRVLAEIGSTPEAIMTGAGFRSTEMFKQEAMRKVNDIYMKRKKAARKLAMDKLVSMFVRGRVSDVKREVDRLNKTPIKWTPFKGYDISMSSVKRAVTESQKPLSRKGVSDKAAKIMGSDIGIEE